MRWQLGAGVLVLACGCTSNAAYEPTVVKVPAPEPTELDSDEPPSALPEGPKREPAANDAVLDLENLADMTCSCTTPSCVEDAKQWAREWVLRFKDTRGGDLERAEQAVARILDCNMDVAMEIARAAK